MLGWGVGGRWGNGRAGARGLENIASGAAGYGGAVACCCGWLSAEAVAVIALGVFLNIAGAPAVQAANECGAGTTVTCTSAGNPYTNGITYSTFLAPSQTVNLQTGVVVTPNSGITGVSLSGILTGVQTVTSAAGVTIETTGDNAGGIRVNSTSDAISITSASVITHGNSTLLHGAQAIDAVTSGSGAAGLITIDASQGAGLLETFGTTSQAVQAQSSGGAIDITVGTVRTHGAGSTAISATILGGTGDLAVRAVGDISASGAGTDAFGNAAGGISVTNNGTGAINVTTKSVSTVADNAGAVSVQGNGGAITIDTTGGTISTAGDGAIGVGNSLGTASGPVTITTGNVNTAGFLSLGVSGLAKGPTLHSPSTRQPGQSTPKAISPPASMQSPARSPARQTPAR